MIIKSHEIPKIVRGHWSTTGLAGYWPMMPYEVFGSIVHDLSWTGNNGTFTGSGNLWIPGSYGAAVLTTNAGGIICDNAKGLTSSFTAVMNISVEDFSTDGSFFYIGDGTSAERYIFYTGGADNLYVFTPDNANCWILTTPFAVQTWVILVLVIEVGVPPRVYLNGSLLTPSSSSNVTAQNNLDYIGFGFDPSYDDKQCNLGFLFIYNRVLPIWQIAEISRNPFLPIEREPIELWVGATSVGVAAGIAAYTHHYQQQL